MFGWITNLLLMFMDTMNASVQHPIYSLLIIIGCTSLVTGYSKHQASLQEIRSTLIAKFVTKSAEEIKKVSADPIVLQQHTWKLFKTMPQSIGKGCLAGIWEFSMFMAYWEIFSNASNYSSNILSALLQTPKIDNVWTFQPAMLFEILNISSVGLVLFLIFSLLQYNFGLLKDSNGKTRTFSFVFLIFYLFLPMGLLVVGCTDMLVWLGFRLFTSKKAYVEQVQLEIEEKLQPIVDEILYAQSTVVDVTPVEGNPLVIANEHHMSHQIIDVSEPE